MFVHIYVNGAWINCYQSYILEFNNFNFDKEKFNFTATVKIFVFAKNCLDLTIFVKNILFINWKY